MLKARYRHLVEHLPIGAAVGALLRKLTIDAVAAVRAGPLDGLALALHTARLVAHLRSSRLVSEVDIMAPAQGGVTPVLNCARQGRDRKDCLDVAERSFARHRPLGAFQRLSADGP